MASALLLLVVTTMLGIAMFRSFGLLEKIAGNTREKERALHAAESAQTAAEWWLTSARGVNATVGTPCSAILVGITNAQVRSNALTTATTLPWTAGVQYAPPGLPTGSPGSVGNFVQNPLFYISYLSYSYNPGPGTSSYSYIVDAAGYAGNTNAVAVTESTFNVSVTYTIQTGSKWKKFVSLGGP